MLNIAGKSGRYCDGVSRRTFLSIGSLAMGGVALPELLQAGDRSAGEKGTIMIMLPGGPPHLDMFDLKPDAPPEIRGELRPIRTTVPGMEISELFPRMAQIADKLIPVRSLVGAPNDHNLHQCVTGWDQHPEQVGSKEIVGFPPGGWPSYGAVLSQLAGPAARGMPSTVDLSPDYYDSRFVKSTRLGEAGFLGPSHTGFNVDAVDRTNFTLADISLDRLNDRRGLLRSFDRFRRQLDASGTMEQMDAFTRQAYEVLSSSRLADALDLGKEDKRIRDLYGVHGKTPHHGDDSHLDQFLLARRVIEAGARCVTLVFSRYPFGRFSQGDFNWDWHKDNFVEARATLPLLDIGISALVTDLQHQGLLDDISIVVWGEFGRTPKINATGGRDHWPQVAGALLAGGGMRGGQVLGATNRFGEHVTRRPVHFREVFATLYNRMGVDVKGRTFDDLAGRPTYLLGEHDVIDELI